MQSSAAEKHAILAEYVYRALTILTPLPHHSFRIYLEMCAKQITSKKVFTFLFLYKSQQAISVYKIYSDCIVAKIHFVCRPLVFSGPNCPILCNMAPTTDKRLDIARLEKMDLDFLGN